jgi:hypothetical protein
MSERAPIATTTAERRAMPPGEAPPFFIVGSGRSGTTLLRLILCAHSRLHIPPETWFIAPLVAAFPLTAPLSPEQAARAVEMIVSDYRWPDMEMDAAALRAAVASLPAPRLAEILAPIYRHHLRAAGKVRFGDKTPPYIEIVPQLATLYPGARFIHLIRDGRDVAISFADVGWESRAYHGPRFEWARAVRRGLAYRDTPLASQILEVRYEDLVREPERTVRGICAFLGEAFEPEMLRWRERPGAGTPERERHIHGKLTQPILADAASVWRRKLSAVECFLIEASLHRDLERLGYALRYRDALWRPLLAATGVMLRAAAPLLDRVLPALRRRNYLPRPIYV